MAIYVYTYSGYPEERASKYFVGDYRKGNAYTYQVVPQLQRELDRRGYENKSPLDEKRFEQLRSDGHLYTENRSGKRRPLYGSTRRLEDAGGWQRLADWIGGHTLPGEVQWFELGRDLRRQLQEGRPLIEELRERTEAISTPTGAPYVEVYERLRSRHLNRTWFHLRSACTLEELAAANSREWDVDLGDPDPERVAEAGLPCAEAWPLDELVRETRPAVGPIDESEFFAALVETSGASDVDGWEELLETVGEAGEWYEHLSYREGEAVRVPTEPLYELQWRAGRMLEKMALHHECAPALEVEEGAALHARFHEGPSRAVAATIEGYPDSIAETTLRREFRLEAEAGAFRGWSGAAVDALVDLLVDPETGRLSAASPSSSVAAEFGLWELDDDLRRRAEALSCDEAPWRYSRLGSEIVVSTTRSGPRQALSGAVESIAEVLSQHGRALAEGSVRMWERGGERLRAGELLVPRSAGESVDFDSDARRRVERAVEIARESTCDEAERATLQRAHRVTGEVPYAALGDPSFRRDVRSLLHSIAMGEFHEEIVRGFFERTGFERDDDSRE